MKKYLSLIILIVVISGCKKSFLEEKPNSNIAVPATLEDFQLLLDNHYVMNVTPGLAQLSSDDHYYSTFQAWQAATALERNAYAWTKDVYDGLVNVEDWNASYKTIYYSNIILKGLEEVAISNRNMEQWNNIKGAALFFRGFAFYSLADVFSMPFDNATAAADMGIPIRLSADIDQLEQRAPLSVTYEQILTDLHQSVSLLSATLPAVRNRPSKIAAFGALARVYLSMRNYEQANAYADSALKLYNKLIDFNAISTTSTTPFSINNDESIIRYTVINMYATLSASSTVVFIDTTLFRSYHDNDLRKAIFFRTLTNGTGIKRGYAGSGFPPFSGIATDELLLIRAECRARSGSYNEAMDDLNTLLRLRWKKVNGVSTYVDQSAASSTEALEKILPERRKELVFRGLRWSDVRRLNKEGANITMKRILDGQTYELAPNSPRFALPIPDVEVAMSGVQQNPR